MVDHSELKRLAEDVNSHFPEKEDLWNMVCTPTVALGLIADIERFKTEIAGLKTGYEAYEQVNAGLKTNVEGLRKALAECANSLHGEMLQKYHGQKPEGMHPVTRRDYDRDMSELAGYAAMSKGEQS